jgi:hypothetical protein
MLLRCRWCLIGDEGAALPVTSERRQDGRPTLQRSAASQFTRRTPAPIWRRTLVLDSYRVYKEGVSAMRTSSQTETGLLECRWSQVGQHVQYNPRWMRDASRNVCRNIGTPSFLDFTRLSPFAGRTWFRVPCEAQGETKNGTMPFLQGKQCNGFQQPPSASSSPVNV